MAIDQRKPVRSAAALAAMMTGYEQGGLTRREYCRRQGVPLSTFDSYRQRRGPRPPNPALVEVKIEEEAQGQAQPGVAPPVLTVVLNNGRRIEVSPGFAEAELARLLRVAERS